jgi:hypothetical protein
LKGTLDEIALYRSEIVPIAVSLSAPDKGVWFKDAVKIACYSMLISDNKEFIENSFGGEFNNRGFVYYCLDGETY